jgi:hypothetical protein
MPSFSSKNFHKANKENSCAGYIFVRNRQSKDYWKERQQFREKYGSWWLWYNAVEVMDMHRLQILQKESEKAIWQSTILSKKQEKSQKWSMLRVQESNPIKKEEILSNNSPLDTKYSTLNRWCPLKTVSPRQQATPLLEETVKNHFLHRNNHLHLRPFCMILWTKMISFLSGRRKRVNHHKTSRI